MNEHHFNVFFLVNIHLHNLQSVSKLYTYFEPSKYRNVPIHEKPKKRRSKVDKLAQSLHDTKIADTTGDVESTFTKLKKSLEALTIQVCKSYQKQVYRESLHFSYRDLWKASEQ